MSTAPAMKSSAPRTTFGTSTGVTSRSVRPTVASTARDDDVDVALAESPSTTFLPLRSAMVRMVVSLRTKNAVGSGWSTPINRRSGSRLFSVATDTSRALARPNSASPRADQRNDHGFAGGRLHQHVHAALFLDDLGDRGAGRVVQRAGLHGREAMVWAAAGLVRVRCDAASAEAPQG